MWVCLNNAFLSIVQPPEQQLCRDVLLVRARRKRDMQKVFPTAKVKRTPGRDYLFRAEIDREEVQDALADLIAGIGYGNFKDSVRDDALHTAYNRVWSIMAGLQSLAPYARTKR